MKLHWKVLSWMLAGVVVGLLLQRFAESRADAGVTLGDAAGGVQIEQVDSGGPADRGKVRAGDVVAAVVLNKGSKDPDRPERRLPIASSGDFDAVIDQTSNGDLIRFELASGEERMVTLDLDADSALARWIEPFAFFADIFMALLKMLIVPVVLTSIVSGVAGVGSLKDLRRLGTKTFSYYIATSLLAIMVGQVLVSLVRPGDGAELGLTQIDEDQLAPDESFIAVLKRMVPSNVFDAFGDNRAMLQIIFFALLLGFFITRSEDPHRERVKGLFDSLFHVMLRMAEGVLLLLPYGVFCLIVRVVAKTGFGVFEPLLLYMALVTVALLVHACVTLPLILRFVGRVSPVRWFKAMSPAIMTAFSTSSSSITLPVTLKTVETRGRVSNRVTSFSLPLGATINMDGTALYECVGVIFLSQYYASTGAFELTFAKQALVVVMALLASIGAAGIPSAGLVMMLSILAALGLPLEGAALLLAVDRPLDMLRTVVNVWSDSCCAAVVARSEGETGPLEAG